ncbi:PadR family transcriptional regulator [Gordonia aurantiaca]|uniref:PadR family transcriptional regulator n=1 Tax=Gordonia sp. B21 TaxID=3151852 RepID=UPI003265C1DF
MKAIERAAVRVHILGAALHTTCSADHVLEELHRRGYRVQPGELKAVLDDLVGRGLLAARDAPVGHGVQTTYEVTPAGRMSWAEECRALSKLTHEVFGTRLPPLPPHVGVDDSQAWLSTADLDDGDDA